MGERLAPLRLGNHLQLLPQLDDAPRRIDPRPELHAGIDLRPAADDGAGVEHAVATGEDAVAEDGAELAAAGVEAEAAGGDVDLAAVVAEVGEDGAGPEVHVRPEDGVADVVEVGGLGGREEKGALELRVRPDHAAVAEPAAAPDVVAGPDLHVPAEH